MPGLGFNQLGLRLPTFAGTRAEVYVVGAPGIGAQYQCRVDGRAWAACGLVSRLPILDSGRHAFQARQINPGGVIGAPPILWTSMPRPGDVAIAGLQMQLVVERSARLLRRAPRVRFALSHPAAVTVDVLRRGHAPLIEVTASGRTGPNVVKVGARRLHALREGRYTVRVTARGATGTTAVQELPLAIVPPQR
jgi:hypothetical protein